MPKDLDQTPIDITNQIEQEEVKQLDSLNDKAVETEPTTSRWCWGHQWRTIDKEKREDGIYLLVRCKRCTTVRTEAYTKDVERKAFVSKKLSYLKGSLNEENKNQTQAEVKEGN